MSQMTPLSCLHCKHMVFYFGYNEDETEFKCGKGKWALVAGAMSADIRARFMAAEWCDEYLDTRGSKP